ncbi:unnamed protein product [Thelazia callipaeda]|uniref:Uncharacterized protein n=1 Tax=Thelazia callipaeda TaxID=103827 RepID=A0A0N5CRK8_THECL|nr:unnamed protein product [Thelazia callipaeda]
MHPQRNLSSCVCSNRPIIKSLARLRCKSFYIICELQEIIVNTILTVLAICSFIVAASFLLERSDWSRYENYRLMVGTAICFIIQSIVCVLMLSWAFYGNVVIIENR